MMTDNDAPTPAAPGPDPADAAASGKEQHSKPHEHFVSPGTESTRELREMARRRRDAEEKLQQHLQEAHQQHEAKDKPAED